MHKCLKEGRLVTAAECGRCEYKRREDDISNIWCRYLIGRIYANEEIKAEIRMTKMEAEAVKTNILRWRNRGVEKAAREYERKYYKLMERIRELEDKL